MSKFRVFVADCMSEDGLSVFNDYPEIEVVINTGLKGDELAAEVRNSDATLLRSSSTIDAATRKVSGCWRLALRRNRKTLQIRP